MAYISRLTLVLLTGLLVILPVPSMAQSDQAVRLKSIPTANIIVEDIPDNSCNVTADQLRTSLAFVLSQSRLKIVKDGTTSIYLRVSMFSDCTAAHIQFEVWASGRIIPSNQVQILTVWDLGYLLGGTENMKARITAEVEVLAKALVVDWSSVNP